MSERVRLADRRAGQLDLFCQPATPLPPRDRTYGLTVQMPNACRCGVEPPCKLAVIGRGKGPHALSVRCWACGIHRG